MIITFKRIFILIFLGLMIFIISCTPKIVKHSYNKHFRAYEITISKGLGIEIQTFARSTNNQKIQSEEEIKEYVEKFNKKSFDIKVSREWDLSERKKYQISELYYGGLRAYKNKDFKTAISNFNKAIYKDKNIVNYSDIYYLIAKSYRYAGKNEQAQEYFKKFINYSERIIHPNFHYFLKDKDGSKINELFDDAENHLKDNYKDKGHDLALKHHEEKYYAKYKNRYYTPGFIKGSNSGLGLIMLGLDYDSTYGFGGYCGIYSGLFKFMDIFLGVRYLSEFQQICISFPLQIYSDNHNRFGIKLIPSFYYNNLEFEHKSEKFDKSFFNFSGNLSMGYYINNYWLAYTGYKYYYYNKENPYKFTRNNWLWKVWNYNSFYIGNTVYIFNDIGITLEYSYDSILAYLEIYLINVGYDISKDKSYIEFFNFNHYF